MAPNRDTSSDGTIGDSAHQARKSDHNPNADGVVTALDITHDPLHGVDAGMLAEMLRKSQDPRIKYVISNRRIFSSKVRPWEWREYKGVNAHTKHVHVSVSEDKTLFDDPKRWAIDSVAQTVTSSPASASLQYVDIVATVFGGRADPNTSAYDGHFITDEELGVALPSPVKAPRPKVRVTSRTTGRAVVCDIVDVGPWNTKDPYWQTHARPQAESGFDLSGRKTNLAGIDLTPAAAHAIGLNGKGKVDWEFVGEGAVRERQTPQIGDPLLAVLSRLIAQATGWTQPTDPIETPSTASGGSTMPASTSDVAALLQQILNVLQAGQAQTASQPTSPAGTAPTPPAQTLPADQVQKILQIIGALIGPGQKPELGQVNGALGQSLGNLLNGKKTAIGIFGALATQLLSAFAPGTGTGAVSAASGILPTIVAAFGGASGLTGVGLPIFLAIAAWGVLGKLEKWSGRSASAESGAGAPSAQRTP